MEKERVETGCTPKKASFDGKNYRIQLPRIDVYFLEEKKIPIENFVIEREWREKERIYSVHLIFGNYRKKSKSVHKTSQEEPDENDDESDYVVLK